MATNDVHEVLQSRGRVREEAESGVGAHRTRVRHGGPRSYDSTPSRLDGERSAAYAWL